MLFVSLPASSVNLRELSPRKGVSDHHLHLALYLPNPAIVSTMHHRAATEQFPSMATDTMTKVRVVFFILEIFFR